jgi:xanthine dehydrogenase YagS FAD-binding subunit
MASFFWKQASDLDDALQAGAREGTLFKAGGIDLDDRLNERIDQPLTVVNLRHVSELDFVRATDGQVSLGPLVTLQRLAQDERLPPALRQASALVGTAEVRARGTLGGNLAQRSRCWYFRSECFHCLRKGGETCHARGGQHEAHAIFDNERCAAVHPSSVATALVALRASVKLRSLRGERTLELEQFFVSPRQDVTRENVLEQGELIVEVLVPFCATSGYAKLIQPGSLDWPLAEAAVALELSEGIVRNASIVLGAAAPTPHRALAAEQALRGERLDGRIGRAAGLALEGATPLPRNRAKLAQLEVVVRRALLSAASRALGSPPGLTGAPSI